MRFLIRSQHEKFKSRFLFRKIKIMELEAIEFCFTFYSTQFISKMSFIFGSSNFKPLTSELLPCQSNFENILVVYWKRRRRILKTETYCSRKVWLENLWKKTRSGSQIQFLSQIEILKVLNSLQYKIISYK